VVGLSSEVGAGNPVLIALFFTVGLVMLFRRVERSEQKVVYPRSGYVQFREEASQLWKSLLFLLLFIFSFMFFFYLVLTYDEQHLLAWITPILATLVGIAMFVRSALYRIGRMLVVGLLALLFGWILSPLILGDEVTRGFIGIGIMGFYLLILGLVFITSGALALRKYLLVTPLQQEAQDE
ncbi:MAG: hypothetical protein L6461_16495, partial [Anaerolineae bacterium]|nr:hypothetical protein [Anaerolineae bacterium]